MRSRVLLLVSVLVAGVVIGSGSAQAGLPSGVTNVAVTAGNTASGINGHLHAARSISGTIKTTKGAAVGGLVQAFQNDHFAGSGFVSNGSYKITGLFAKSYAVCISGPAVFTPASSTGWLGRCYKSAGFNGSTVPSSATLVNLSAGSKSNVNFSVAPAAAISGKVTSPTGAGLNSISVFALNKSSKALFFGFTTSKGTYAVTGLTASAKGYAVCFNAFGNSSGTGFLSRCFHNKSWNGSAGSMGSATTVAVALGHVHSKVNQALPRGGAISGKVVDAGNGKGIPGDGVVVFTSTGHFVSSAGTTSSGAYVVRGLLASTSYRVCASPTNTTTTVRYHGRCWKAIAWNGGRLPSGTNAVGVKLSRTHTGINFRLTKTVIKLGSIAGTITEKAGGQPVQFATVSVFTASGGFAGGTSTDANGKYNVTGLPASSTGYVVCVNASFAASTTPTPTTGWAPRCYVDAAWSGIGVPSAAHKLPLSAGQKRTGVNIAVHVGGAIAGTTTQFGSSTPVPSVIVKVFTTSGHLVTTAFTSFVDGTYSVKSLSPGNYVVCFDGRQSPSGNGFLPQCYNGVAWSG